MDPKTAPHWHARRELVARRNLAVIVVVFVVTLCVVAVVNWIGG